MSKLFWLAALSLAIPASASRVETVRVTVAPTMVKVRPTEPLPPAARGAGPIEILAARNECEDAQVVVTAGDRPVKALTARATPLLRGGESIGVELFREAFLEVKTPSNTEGATGLWPDALVPVVDDVVHEKRNAFPVDVPAHWHQPLLLRICVPAATVPGRYAGAVTLSWTGGGKRVPVRLDVRNVVIPATSSIPVTFGLSGRSVLVGHFGRRRSDAERLELVERYAKEALDHRISLHVMSRIMPKVTGTGSRMRVDFSEWDRELDPLFGHAAWNGARPSAIDLRIPDDLPLAEWHGYARIVAEHFRKRYPGTLLFAYVMDEPKAWQHAELVARLDALADTGVARLVTTSLDPSLAGKVDVWTENVNCFTWKKRRGEYCAHNVRRNAYSAREARGDRVWWYQSCSSQGCNHGPFGDARDQYFRGWPSYMVDVDGAANQAMGWLAFTHRIEGELYYDTVYAYNFYDEHRSLRVDPWTSLWAFGGNGDGTLFYPGRPELIGGRTNIPIASLRLELIRDGLEDYELLRLLAGRGSTGKARALAIARSVAPELYDFSRDPVAWARARRELFDALAPERSAVR